MGESAVQTGPRSVSAAAADLRIGILGAGFIGRVHAHAARLTGARIAGIVASTPERSKAAAAAVGAERGFGGAEELIASDDIDVVHVCAPNSLHVPLASAAIAAGKRVICEKPVALDREGAADLAALAEREGAPVTVPFAYRYYPTVRELRSRLAAGGAAVALVSGGYLQDWLLTADDYNWRVDRELGGASRAFADIGSHLCDLVEFVSGQRLVGLAARTGVVHGTRRGDATASFERAGGGAAHAVENEDVAALLFETDGGAIGSLVVSQVSAGRKNRLWLEVSAGAESYAFEQERPDSLAVMRRSGIELVPRDLDDLGPAATPYVTLPAGHPQGYQDCFDAFVAESYAAFTGAGEQADGLPTLADGVRSVALTEAVLESSRRRRWVEVEAP